MKILLFSVGHMIKISDKDAAGLMADLRSGLGEGTRELESGSVISKASIGAILNPDELLLVEDAQPETIEAPAKAQK